MVKIINLDNNKKTLVDDEDFEFINQWKWRFHISNPHGQGYAYRTCKDNNIFMHRVIMNRINKDFPIIFDKKTKIMIDHINRDRLDNRRQNIRIATNRENQLNSIRQNRSYTNYQGIFKQTSGSPGFRVLIKRNGKQLYLGSFKDKEQAREARNKYYDSEKNKKIGH